MTFDEAVAFALTLPDTELSTSYGKPAVKVASNGRAFLFPSHEPDTSFGVAIDLDTIEILKATDPDTFWQTPHYEGWPGVLIRYDSKDEERVRDVIAARATGLPRSRRRAAQAQVKRFESYVAIDWSGAKGKRHKGIAIAEARGESAPRLVRAGHIWSREEVLQWLLKRAAKEPTLFGFDFSLAPPLIERGEYLPGEPDVSGTAREFWAYVDRMSDDEDLGAASFLENAHRRHFYFGIADGVKAGFMHFRQCDARLNAQGGRKIASAYDAIGAAQVAKASFSGMRLMHRLDGKVAIWPMDPLPNAVASWSRSTPGSIFAAPE